MVMALYDPGILAHSRTPRNTVQIADAAASARVDNRLCGDRVTVQVGTGAAPDRLGDVACQCKGCAVCVASGSVMTGLVAGEHHTDVEALADRVISALTDGADCPMPGDLPAEIAVFWPVRQFPSRRRCATLPWEALRAALARLSTTERA